MLHSLNEVSGYKLATRDGEIGKVADVLFDDVTWQVRYLVVNTGSWLRGRSVLISPASAEQADPKRETIAVNLSSSQVEKSPSIDARLPVSRDMEIKMAEHYNWPTYWHGPFIPAFGPAVPWLPPDSEASEPAHPHLRSLGEVTGYHIEAKNGSIGHVEEFLYQPDAWRIRFMVVDTKNWLPGRKVIVALRWIDDIMWPDGKLRIDLSREEIENAPVYNPPLTPEYERQLFNHYGRPCE